MARSLVLSNSELCVALDQHALVRDVYYPHVGHENHVRGHYLHRIGVWTDGRMSWLHDGGWHIAMGLETNALVGMTTARHDDLGIELQITDAVSSDKNIFLRRIHVKNTIDRTRDIKLFFGHEFEIQKMHGSNTAYFDPRVHAIVHYKGRRVFLMSATLEGDLFTDFTTGRAHFHDREGSYMDAEDGELAKNPIEHGPADSMIGLSASYGGRQERLCEYWMIAAQSIPEAHEMHEFVRRKTPAHMLSATVAHWHRWIRPLLPDFHDLDEAHRALYAQSLLYTQAHVDRGGGIIASVDSDMFQYGLDDYSYVWMRDSAYIARALDSAGDSLALEKLFIFCKEVITRDGYFMHKYQPDTSLGSSWHPWIVDGRVQLPIQEDETAIILFVLAEYMRRHHNLELLQNVYEPLVERSAAFLMSYRDERTRLPQPSYDLWERKRGTSTYTSASVYAALRAAAELARFMHKDDDAAEYESVAREVQEGILKHLWHSEDNLFYNMIDGVNEHPDVTIDISSVYGVFLFGVLEPKEMRLLRAFDTSVRYLSEGVAIGGIARFQHDDYYRVPGPSTGNPWILTTLWYAQYLIAKAATRQELAHARDIFTWVTRHALPTGVLSEQLDPQTGVQVGTGPLAWSHATYVQTVREYLTKWEALAS